MSKQERKWTREMDDSEKEAVSVITCDMEGRVETFSAGAEKILAGEQRTAARRARRRGDEGVLEQHPLVGDAIERRRLDDGVRAGTGLDLGVGAGVLAPVVGERKQDVRPLLLGQAGQRQ